ncbi:molybdate transport system ATP-binding protein [Rhizobium skierniewicense]|uniref:Molybdate transport system ATP-binding protein n=1 Tax=Rhizobium skierniewicense TaxID=984260 RepID=A0A7W6C5T0_9HYPH|nr:molybdenum ABC transporter ATP-binding protein [Rhizobium skierniewicense]MBB3946272.1 molybdate transport system ATP-binding protein [Rhizobium skierniewicense]
MTLTLTVQHRLDAFTLDADLTAGKGVTALFGRSGSGKTSLIRIIAGLTRPDQAVLKLDDTVLADSANRVFTPCHKRRFGTVFQEARLFPHLTVEQNLHYGRWFSGKTSVEADSAGIIDMLGIGALLKRRPEKLSGGEKQRVAIGRALLSSPRLLLMDEPLAALDEARKAEIIPYLERLRDETKIPIIYVSHSVAEVSRLADQIVVMKDGRIDAAGPAAEILSRPAFNAYLERREIGSILSGSVDAFDGAHGLATIRLRGLVLHVPSISAKVGHPVRVHIPARDVMLATVKPEGLSALNILKGRIADIVLLDDGMAMVHVNCNSDIILSRITRMSVERLALTPEMPIFAVIKSAALDPY